MKSLITITLITSFITFTILSSLLININTDKISDVPIDEENIIKKQKTYLYIYDVLVILFLFLLIFYIIYNGYVKGCIMGLFVWAFFIVSTPIPEAGLLVSLPLKRYLNISIHISQTFVSLLALFVIYYLYFNEYKTINKCIIGKLFTSLNNFKYYSIIIISIICSIFTSEFIDNIIDNYINKEKINYIHFKLGFIAFLIIIYSFLMNSLINKINKN